MNCMTLRRSRLMYRRVAMSGAPEERIFISLALAPGSCFIFPWWMSNTDDSPETPASTLPAINDAATWGVPPICRTDTSASGRRPMLRSAARKKVSPPDPYWVTPTVLPFKSCKRCKVDSGRNRTRWLEKLADVANITGSAPCMRARIADCPPAIVYSISPASRVCTARGLPVKRITSASIPCLAKMPASLAIHGIVWLRLGATKVAVTLRCAVAWPLEIANAAAIVAKIIASLLGLGTGITLLCSLFVPGIGAKDSSLGRVLAQLEFRALDVAAPDIDRAANRIDDRLMCGVVESAVAPAKLYGKSPWGLYINVYGLTVNVPARSHTNGRLVDAQEVIRAHDVIERLHFQHYVLQPGRLAWHAWSESHTVMALVATQEAQTNVVVDAYPITQAKAQHTGVELMRPLGVLYRQQHVSQAQDTQITGIAHRLFVNLKAIRQS